MTFKPLKAFFGFLYFCVYLIAITASALISAKMRRYWSQRIYRKDFTRASTVAEGRPIWIHAASGEFEYARAVLKSLKSQGQPTLVSFFSPSYSKTVLRNQWVDFAEPLPLDLPGPMGSFLARYRPKALWIARTDLWPEMIDQCKSENIPVIVFSAARSVPSSRGARWMARLSMKALWNKVDQVYCVDQKDADEFRRLGLEAPIETLGDTRYDQAIDRVEQRKVLAPLEQGSSTPLLVAGSTWEEDESVILPQLVPFLKAGRLRLALVPHEPHEETLSRLTRFFETHAIKSERYSQTASWNSSVLLVDQMGLLADLYSYGQLAFVGGSYKSKVHSVMEPLAAGVPTLVGPKNLNNREAQDFSVIPLDESRRHLAVSVCPQGEDFKDTIEKFLLAGRWGPWKKTLQQKIRQRRGASERLVQRALSRTSSS